jgi:hypothetical protein
MALLGVAVVIFGLAPPTFGVALVTFAGSIAGIGDRLNRHQAEMIAEMQSLAKLVSDVQQKNPASVEDAVQVIGNALKLKQEMAAEDSEAKTLSARAT